MARSSSILVLLAAAILVVGCSGAPVAQSVSPPSASSSPGSPGPAAVWLDATTTQAISPVYVFAIAPAAVISTDGTYVTAGPVAEIYPQPALPNLIGRAITDAGRARIVAQAQQLGLLSGKTDFTAGAGLPGAAMGRIAMTVDGGTVTLTGDPTASIGCATPCEPSPGTPAAFAELWARLQAPASWLAADVGPEAPYVADAYSLLVGPPPTPNPGTTASLMDWPLAVPLATFGGPVMDGSYRCGTVSGADADTLRPSLEAATQVTQWVQDPGTSATFGISVRPLVPGEDACTETFGA